MRFVVYRSGVVAGCAAGLYAGGERIARLGADATARDLGSARDLLTARVPDPDAVGAGVEKCEAALARYGLPGAADWEARDEFRALPADEQQKVREPLTEASVFLARGYALQARPGELDRATAANATAERVAGAAPPRAVLEQRAERLRRRGDTPGAEQAAARAAAAPLSSGRDYYQSGAAARAAGRFRWVCKFRRPDARAPVLAPGRQAVRSPRLPPGPPPRHPPRGGGAGRP